MEDMDIGPTASLRICMRVLGDVQRQPRECPGLRDVNSRVAQQAGSSYMQLLRQKYPAKLHAQKVSEQLQQGRITRGLLYLPGQVVQRFEDTDAEPPFRQRRYFYYLAGIDSPGCIVTYHVADDHLILWIPKGDPRRELYYGTVPTPADYGAQTDIEDIRYTQDLASYLESTLDVHTPLFALHDTQVPQPLPHKPGVVLVDTIRLQPAIDEARVVKTPYEVAMIRRANDISSSAHRAVLARLRWCANERDIEAIFSAHCTVAGAHRQAYPIIAGSGPNAATLHYDANDAPLRDGRQLVVLDAGAAWKCYAADVTRTFPISGSFSAEARGIYDAVAAMQEACITLVRPGEQYVTLARKAILVAAEGLLKLGILRGASAEDLARNGTVSAFFPHGLGHHVGLEVHDVAGHDALYAQATDVQGGAQGQRAGKRAMFGSEEHVQLFESDGAGAPRPPPKKRTLQPNMVLTIEPGIYFSRSWIESFFLSNPQHSPYIDGDVLEKYYAVGGVRIEDDILVTKDGYENLTSAPKGEEMLRIINGGKD